MSNTGDQLFTCRPPDVDIGIGRCDEIVPIGTECYLIHISFMEEVRELATGRHLPHLYFGPTRCSQITTVRTKGSRPNGINVAPAAVAHGGSMITARHFPDVDLIQAALD